MALYKIKYLIFDGLIFAYLAAVAWVLGTSPSEEQLMDLQTNFLLCLALFVVGAIVSILINKTKMKTLGALLFEPDHMKGKNTKSFWKSFAGLQFVVTFLVTFATGSLVTEFSFYELFDDRGMGGAKRLFQALIDPDLSILPIAILKIIETVYIAFMATALAIPLAFILSFLCAKNIMGKTSLGFAVYATLRTLLNVTRSVEALVWAIIFTIWVGVGPFAGMLALMLHSVASLAKQYSEIVECVSEGPIEGVQATGANSLQVVWFSIVPQIVLPYVAFTIYRWDINVRMATIIGLVGGGGIGTLLMQYQGQALWHQVGCLALVIAVTVWLMDTASAYIREAIK